MGTTKFNNQKNLAGSIIKKYRESRGMEIKELCEKLQLRGVSIDRQKIYMIENNKILLKDFELIMIFKILNVDLNILKDLIE